MMHHPIDIPSREDQDRATPPGSWSGGFWTLIALAVVVGLVVAIGIVMGGDALHPDTGQPSQPVPHDAPALPGE